jgi:hypothetical protein
VFTLRTPCGLFCLDTLKLLTHGGMINRDVVTTRRPLFRGEYPFFVLGRWFDGLHDLRMNGTYWYHVCLVPFWITVAEENEYREEDVDGELENL